MSLYIAASILAAPYYGTTAPGVAGWEEFGICLDWLREVRKVQPQAKEVP